MDTAPIIETASARADVGVPRKRAARSKPRIHRHSRRWVFDASDHNDLAAPSRSPLPVYTLGGPYTSKGGHSIVLFDPGTVAVRAVRLVQTDEVRLGLHRLSVRGLSNFKFKARRHTLRPLRKATHQERSCEPRSHPSKGRSLAVKKNLVRRAKTSESKSFCAGRRHSTLCS